MALTESGGAAGRLQTPAVVVADQDAGSRGIAADRARRPSAPPWKDPVLRVAAILITLLSAWYVAGPGEFPAEMRLSMLISALLNLGGMICSLAVIRILREHPARRFWVAMAVGGALFTLADLIQLAGPVSDPIKAVVARGGGPATIVQGLAVLVFVAVILSYPMRFASRREVLCFWLDMSTVLVAVGAFELSTVVEGVTSHGRITWYEVMLGPVAMLIAVFALAKLILRGTVLFPPATAIAGLGCAALGGASTLVAPLLSGTGQEHWAFLLLPISSSLFLAAARFGQIQISSNPGVLARRRRRPYSLLPYAAIVAVYALLLSTLPTRHLDGRHWVVVISAVISTGLVVVRQITSFEENNRLLTDLRTALAQRDALQSELHRRAFFDSLTGLANRALFMDRLETACRQARRDARSLAVMIIDLDDFKPVNDRYGHATGDAVLAEVATRLSDTLRKSDTVARLGGDEFAVVLHDPLPEKIDAIAARVSAAARGPCTIGERQVSVSASIGVAVDRHGRYAPDALISQADDAMYRAKCRFKGGYDITELPA